MSETVAKGDVLIPAHNLSTNWLPEKKQEEKNTSGFQADWAETGEVCNSIQS